MASITFAIDDELKQRMAKFLWVSWSEVVREVLIEREKICEELLKKLKSEKEKELIRWSVELGRKVKKGRFKRLFTEPLKRAI